MEFLYFLETWNLDEDLSIHKVYLNVFVISESITSSLSCHGEISPINSHFFYLFLVFQFFAQFYMSNMASTSMSQERCVDLVFRDICATLGGRQILHNVSGMVKQGTMLAIMGSSGKLGH